jgi:hypothetical protein
MGRFSVKTPLSALCQLFMTTSGSKSRARISSPFRMSFSSTLAAAACLVFSMPARTCLLMSRSLAVSGGTSTNHLGGISQGYHQSKWNIPFVEELCNCVPGVLVKQEVVSLHNDDFRRRRHMDVIIHRILNSVIKARQSQSQIRTACWSHGSRLQRSHILDQSSGVEGERRTSSPERNFGSFKRRQHLLWKVKAIPLKFSMFHLT